MPFKDREKELAYHKKYNKEYYLLHSERIAVTQSKKRARWRQEGRCSSCGTKLVQGEKRTCVNCGNTIKGALKYAKDSQRLTQNI
jgi:predicted RNA-binding Zn-ribbon protein involved in translation (DUF1610 family)